MLVSNDSTSLEQVVSSQVSSLPSAPLSPSKLLIRAVTAILACSWYAVIEAKQGEAVEVKSESDEEIVSENTDV